MSKTQGKSSRSGTPKTVRPSPGKFGWKTVFLLFFFSGWSFLVGVLVGRGTAPVHFDMQALESRMADLKSSLLEQPAPPLPEEGVEPMPPTQLGFYENLKETKPRISLLKAPPPEPAAPDPPRREAPRPAKEKPARAAAAASPAPPKAEPAPPPSGGMTIQVASLKDAQAAAEMVARLKQKGYPAYRVAAEVPGRGTWHRVRVGRFASAAEAGDALAGLKQERMEGFLVKMD